MIFGCIRKCRCRSVLSINNEIIFEEFQVVRQKCLALNKILVPDEIWEQFQSIAFGEYDEALHQYAVLTALSRGYLHKITSPIHKYLLENRTPKCELTDQYKKDLRERWMLQGSIKTRHRTSKIFLGKIIELQCAYWLEQQKWTVTSLAALGGDYDITACSPDKTEFTIETKYIGREEWSFESIVEGNTEGASVKMLDAYFPANYLWFIIGKAAQQLQNSKAKKIILIFIHCWDHFRFAIEILIDWKNPSYHETVSWNRFSVEKDKKMINAVTLCKLLKNIEYICLIKVGEGFEFTKQKTIWF